jgi:hypothetical protein
VQLRRDEWARITEGQVAGDEFVDLSKARDTTLTGALAWYEKVIVPKKPRMRKNTPSVRI